MKMGEDKKLLYQKCSEFDILIKKVIKLKEEQKNLNRKTDSKERLDEIEEELKQLQNQIEKIF